MNKKGFSLLEILIVLVVVVILTSFLYPSLISAKEESKRVADASQLQQILKAYTLYIGDHEGQVPFVTYNGSKAKPPLKKNSDLFREAKIDPEHPYATWVIFLYPYLKSKEIFWSPASNITKKTFMKENRFQGGGFTVFPSWGYNGCYFSVIKDGQVPNVLSHSEPINECLIEEPASTLVFASSTSNQTIERRSIKDAKVELGDFLIVPPSVNDKWQSRNNLSSPISHNHFGYLYPRFKNKTICNVGFADGHVKGIHIDKLKDEKIWQIKKDSFWQQN